MLDRSVGQIVPDAFLKGGMASQEVVKGDFARILKFDLDSFGYPLNDRNGNGVADRGISKRICIFRIGIDLSPIVRKPLKPFTFNRRKPSYAIFARHISTAPVCSGVPA